MKGRIDAVPGNGAFQRFDGKVCVPGEAMAYAENSKAWHMSGAQVQCPPRRCETVAELSERLARLSQCSPGLPVVGMDAYGALKRGRRDLRASRLQRRAAEIDEGVPVFRFQLKRPSIGFKRFVGAAQIHEDIAQIVLDMGLVGLLKERSTQPFFGRRIIACRPLDESHDLQSVGVVRHGIEEVQQYRTSRVETAVPSKRHGAVQRIDA